MSGAEDLISILMSDKKLKNSKAFSTKIYKDEPIFKTASQLAPRTGNDVPDKLQELAQALRDADFYSMPSAQRFCKCAAITEDFEDDYANEEKFARYFPNYEVMSNEQLRTYFTWRTHVRKGDVKNTYPSYFYLYVYELINQIGVTDVNDGYSKLRNVWKAFRKYDPGIDRNMKLWLRDYIVYYGLDKSLLSEIDSPEKDSALSVLLKCPEYADEELFEAMCIMSTFKIRESSFIKEYHDEYRKVMCSVFREMSAYYSKHRARSLCEKLFGRGYDISYTMFYSAIFFDTRRYEEYDYVINDGYRYSCRNGSWKCVRFSGGQSKSADLGIMMRNTDCIMRLKFDFHEKKDSEKMTKNLREIIFREAEKCISEKKIAEEKKIIFDFSVLEDIRRSADATCEKLTVEEEPDMYEREIQENTVFVIHDDHPVSDKEIESNTTETVSEKDDETLLDETEKKFVRCLLLGNDYRSVLKSAHMMVSIAADSVNEKLFDLFGDTVIDFDGEEPYIIEDYTEELKGMFG